MTLLLATAPWPILVRIVTTRPGPWTIWGDLPAAVTEFLKSEGHAILPEPLPRPFHRHALPDTVTSRSWQAIVVPALAHPLPTRWPFVRHLAPLGHPVIVSDGECWQWVHHEDIPAEDAYTWALDRLEESPAPAPSSPDTDLLCVHAGSLGDVLLTWPALEAASHKRRVTLLARDCVTPWIATLARGAVDVRGLAMDEWAGEPDLPTASEVVDLGPSDTTSPLTPALAHAVSARRRTQMLTRRAYLSVSETIAEILDVRLLSAEGGRPRAEGRTGLLCPSGSTPERELDIATWADLARVASEALGVDRWTIIGASRDRAAAIASVVPNASPAPFPSQPDAVVAMVDAARAALGVSSAFAHLAALRHVPTIVIEHPTRLPFLHHVPGDHAHYVRPSSPWWRAQPDSMDVARSTSPRSDSYGFWPDELIAGVEEAARRLASLGSAVAR